MSNCNKDFLIALEHHDMSFQLHHTCHVITSFVINEFISLSLLCHHILGYSFVITELLWHQWQPHSTIPNKIHWWPLRIGWDNLLGYVYFVANGYLAYYFIENRKHSMVFFYRWFSRCKIFSLSWIREGIVSLQIMFQNIKSLIYDTFDKVTWSSY